MNFAKSDPKGSKIGGSSQLGIKTDKWDKPSLKKELALPAFDLSEALCAQTDPEIFFPEKGGSALPAKAICKECPVRMQCLEWALKNDERHGIWGGLSPKERDRLMSRRTEIVSIKKVGRPRRNAAPTQTKQD